MSGRNWLAGLVGCVALAVAGCGGGGAGGDKITLVGRQNNSGTYDYFREEVLGKDGQFRQGISAQSGSKDVVELVSKTPTAIGYSGHGYSNEHVKVLKVSKKTGGEAIDATMENARAGKYPLARKLFIFTNGEPSPTAKHYLTWIQSAEGQKIVEAEGYVPNVQIGPDAQGSPPAGSISSEGSDTMIQLAGKWAEVYMKKHPQVKITVQGGGSGKGIASLIGGTVELCNSSRDLKAEEREKAKAKSGKDVLETVVGLDALAIYVHKNNTLDAISIEQLAQIYGKTGTTTTWSQLKPAAANGAAAAKGAAEKTEAATK